MGNITPTVSVTYAGGSVSSVNTDTSYNFVLNIDSIGKTVNTAHVYINLGKLSNQMVTNNYCNVINDNCRFYNRDPDKNGNILCIYNSGSSLTSISNLIN